MMSSPSMTTTANSFLFTIPEETETHSEDADSKNVQVQLQYLSDDPQLQETTQLRTQLSTLQDEVNDSKDFIQAVLGLRQWESQKAAESVDHLLSDREHSRAEAITLNSQLSLLEERVRNLYIESIASSQEHSVLEKLKHLVSTSPRLHSHLPEHKDARDSLKQAQKLLGPDAELMLLREQLEGQKAENRDLKTEMEAKAERKKDEEFRADVAEAVRQERVKDEFVVQSLRRENSKLRKLLGENTALKW